MSETVISSDSEPPPGADVALPDGGDAPRELGDRCTAEGRSAEDHRESPTDAASFAVESGPPDAGERRQRRIFATLVLIAVLLGLFTIYFARTVLMPIVAAVILALLFRPVVRRLRRYRLPDSIGAAVVLLTVVLVVFSLFANLIGPAREWLDDAPANLREVGKKLHVIRDQVDNLSRASEVVEKLARGEVTPDEPPEAPFPFAPEPNREDEPTGTAMDAPDSAAAATPDPTERLEKDLSVPPTEDPIAVEVRQPRIVAGLTVLSSTGSAAAELLMMLVLAYFLLATGDMLINNVLRILPSMREKRNAVELVHNVEHGISSYLLTVTLINVVLGMMIALAMWLLGLPNPILWGAMATIFNFVPFLGALCGTIVILLVSVLTFGLGYAVIPPLVFWGITALEGNVITPHILGRQMSLNPIMVFLSLIIWGWMWGIGGAFLAVPILATLKVGFDQFDDTRPLGTLLGGDPHA